MAKIIIQNNNVYNLYCTIADDCIFAEGCTEQQLTEWYIKEYGVQGINSMPRRLQSARMWGTSSAFNDSWQDTVCCNRSGPDETTLTEKQFADKYLTLVIE